MQFLLYLLLEKYFQFQFYYRYFFELNISLKISCLIMDDEMIIFFQLCPVA